MRQASSKSIPFLPAMGILLFVASAGLGLWGEAFPEPSKICMDKALKVANAFGTTIKGTKSASQWELNRVFLDLPYDVAIDCPRVSADGPAVLMEWKENAPGTPKPDAAFWGTAAKIGSILTDVPGGEIRGGVADCYERTKAAVRHDGLGYAPTDPVGDVLYDCMINQDLFHLEVSRRDRAKWAVLEAVLEAKRANAKDDPLGRTP